MLNATNVDVLMNATDREGSRVPQPPPTIVERVSFLCNNLSQVNLRQLTEEIKVLIRECGENFLRWFAQYLVMKRVTLEQNFQPLYNSFLLYINDENLDRFVKQETFRNIKILLRSDKGNAASNFGDRQLLKNLGLWLGQMTIARNKPILARDLDLICLLFEAFYKGQQELLYVVPFVAKTLLSCTKSELFVPNCAWIHSIIKVLAEIHNEPDLKLNLKFEIEVLCKDLGIDLVQIEPTGVLKDSAKLLHVLQQLNELPPLIQPDSMAQLPLPSGIPTTIKWSRDWYYPNSNFESQVNALSVTSVSAPSMLMSFEQYLSRQQYPYLSDPFVQSITSANLVKKFSQHIYRQPPSQLMLNMERYCSTPMEFNNKKKEKRRRRPKNKVNVTIPSEKTAEVPFISEMDKLRNTAELVIREWMSVFYSAVTQQNQKHVLVHMVQSMIREGFLHSDEVITIFFQMYLHICLDVSDLLLKMDAQLSNQARPDFMRQSCYVTIDAFTKLICLLIRYSDDPQGDIKVNLLKKILKIIVDALQNQHIIKKNSFDGMPFMQIILYLFLDLTSPSDPVMLESLSMQIFGVFIEALLIIQPMKAPRFTYHWLTIICHRDFMGRFLAEGKRYQKQIRALYIKLIVCHLKFMAPIYGIAELKQETVKLHEETLRLLLVLLYDFPEPLSDHYYLLCDLIPYNCVQLRNLILSAYPRGMYLPDPFKEPMEMIEALPEMVSNPQSHAEMSKLLTFSTTQLKNKLDEFLVTRSSKGLFDQIHNFLKDPLSLKLKISMLNAIVLYVGLSGIDYLQATKQKISINTVAQLSHFEFFQRLAVCLNIEGRLGLVNSLATHLRYPNSHTHFFGCILINLFKKTYVDGLKELVTKVIMQRLSAFQPHPWGLLVTYVELMRNKDFKTQCTTMYIKEYLFWTDDAILCAPEIIEMFLNVAYNSQKSFASERDELGKN